MKYVIVEIDGKEVPMIFGHAVDLDQVQFPWPIKAAGVGVVQSMFISCQHTQTIGGVEYGSRGLKDEILLRMADHIEAEETGAHPLEEIAEKLSTEERQLIQQSE